MVTEALEKINALTADPPSDSKTIDNVVWERYARAAAILLCTAPWTFAIVRFWPNIIWVVFASISLAWGLIWAGDNIRLARRLSRPDMAGLVLAAKEALL